MNCYHIIREINDERQLSHIDINEPCYTEAPTELPAELRFLRFSLFTLTE